MSNRKPDFIGIGGGRSGTRWINVCLYEHPEIHMPVGEPHFFSREKNWSRGYKWYEQLFKDCPAGKKTGEMSNSYLADPETPQKIHSRYPNAKLIVVFRDPADRAFSCYLNDIKAGIISPEVSFGDALKERHHYYVEEGRHATNIKRYFQLFPREQILMLVYDDFKKIPLEILKKVYEFIGVSSSFTPSFLNREVNLGRVPRLVWLDRLFVKTSSFLRKSGLYSIWWLVKKYGIAEKLLRLNTKAVPRLAREDKKMLYEIFESEIDGLEQILNRKLPTWRT